MKAQLQPGRYAFSINRWSFAGIRTEEELQACDDVLDGTSILNSDQALGLINAIRLHGENWLEAPVVRTCASTAGDRPLHQYSGQDFKAASDRKNSENLDRSRFSANRLKTS
ncbi:MAG: hypothetical protein IPL59_16340 [Candidatus Competibacteraceae bacterium]|nr:hypothetical protein [Candidatus Competibacteraceae bacterium]